MIRLRGACKRDYEDIKNLTESWDFNLDPVHLEAIIVAVNEDDKVIGIGSLTKILEGMLVVDKSLSLKDRAVTTQIIMDKVDGVVKELGYDNYHVFGTVYKFNCILEKKFSFVRSIGTAFIKWVK